MHKDLKAKMSRLCFRKDKKVKETGGERTNVWIPSGKEDELED